MHIRTFRWEDLPALVEMMNRHAEALGKSSRVTVEEVERTWRTPYNHPDRDAFVAVGADGQIIGYTIADILDDPHQAFGVYQVLSGNRAAGSVLMQAASDHFHAMALANADPDKPITMDWRVTSTNADAISLCEEQGFEQVRQFYTMRIALDQPLPAAVLPPGFALRPFTLDDLAAVYDAKVEMFQDHWGDQHDPLHEWRSTVEAPHFDPSLWWVAYAGDAIAGIVLSQPTTAETAWVGILGVRRAWRKQGLAQALLQLCFAEYQRRGLREVFLGVDSNSQTNAVKLYQRAGMHIHQTVLYYRQYLRRTES
ncbi:MAG: GNAT family N-acetyltransferase [Anaerolineae bacterium]|nr:GNAT family N-acetyltransferase [Anaerolineae bacterium]